MILSDKNLKSVMARMGGDTDLLVSLLSLLPEQSQVWIDECDVLIDQKDIVGACRWLHTLRGTLGSLGFDDFCKGLEAIERQSRDLSHLNQDEWWVLVKLSQHSLRQLPESVPLIVSQLNAFQLAESSS